MDRFERFTLSVFSITRYWNKIATEEMRKHGLKGAYVLYLITLSDLEEPPTAARLAEMTQRDKADVSRAISTFQKMGIVEPYGENRYRAPVRLTEAGMKLAGEVRRKADSALLQAGQGLSEEMRRNMYRSLDLIAGNMNEICKNLTD